MLEGYPDILKVPEVSKILRIGIQKVYKLLKNGEIKNRKIDNLYLISKEDLIKYIREKGIIFFIYGGVKRWNQK